MCTLIQLIQNWAYLFHSVSACSSMLDLEKNFMLILHYYYYYFEVAEGSYDNRSSFLRHVLKMRMRTYPIWKQKTFQFKESFFLGFEFWPVGSKIKGTFYTLKMHFHRIGRSRIHCARKKLVLQNWNSKINRFSWRRRTKGQVGWFPKGLIWSGYFW